MKKAASNITLIIGVALYLAALANLTFFRKLLDIYPLSLEHLPFLISVFIGLVIVLILLFSALCHQWLVKPILIAALLLSSVLAYFMDQYGILVDETMIENSLKTDPREVADLFNPLLLVYILFIGVLPGLIVAKIPVAYPGHWKETTARLKLVAASLALFVAMIWSLSDYYASFFRAHKKLTMFTNPTFALYSAGVYASRSFHGNALAFQEIGNDAHIPQPDPDRELIIFVVGETARAANFSLNGYHRLTNPRLAQEKVISFSNVSSCGTSTAVSVPCMFSIDGRRTFDSKISAAKSNALDILKKAGVNILWRDNNSSSKGVADRVRYEDFRFPSRNPVCDPECRDIGMLAGLDDYIAAHPTGDILIVLHQMGSHGPAYYKRYPKRFKVFTPTCETNKLSDCSREEVVNTYDNTILYTDYFLAEVIRFLKRYDESFKTAMIYVSDHGESLGEKGLYLHGYPYFLAPKEQTHVPLIMWFGQGYDPEALRKISDIRNRPVSHDNLFSTLLGLFGVRTKVYDPKLDLLNPSFHDGADKMRRRITQREPIDHDEERKYE